MFISVVILEAYLRQLHFLNLWTHCRNCYLQCGPNSCILSSNLWSSQMKREKSSPKDHFILINTWKNSKHNLGNPVGYSSLCWSLTQVPAFWLSRRIFSGLLHVLQLLARSISWISFLNRGRIKEQMALSWFCQSSATGGIFPVTVKILCSILKPGWFFLVYLTWWRQYGETKPGSRCFHNYFSRLAPDSEVLLAVQRSPWHIK